MTALSVNINKIALLRNQRDNDVINLSALARSILEAGADGITVHPRPDERHVRFGDLAALKQTVDLFAQHRPVELNVEGYPSEHFLKALSTLGPDQVTLVPDPPEAKTSEYGWNIYPNLKFLKETVNRLHDHGMRVSLFIDPDEIQVYDAAKTGCDAIELHTGSYADAFARGCAQNDVQRYIALSLKARSLGLSVNAGHDLNRSNLKFLSASIPWLSEVSIGHALVADCLEMGLVNCVRAYKGRLQGKVGATAKSA